MGAAISHGGQQADTAVNLEAVFGPLQAKSVGVFALSCYC